MLIKNLSKPFHHTIIYDFYSKEEEEIVWKELEFLNKPGKLFSPKNTGDPRSSPNKTGIFLHQVYENLNFSDIFLIHRKIYKLKNCIKENIFHEYFYVKSLYDVIMISYYENKSYYEFHRDDAILSAVTTFWKTPKKFTGGKLTFPDYNYTPKMNHNTLILFPSFVLHEVTEIKMKNDDKINGRYTINQFFATE